ncbi:MAG: GIY-YIG nuclease family protein [Anaerolineae bacterium]|nr:GIY-YIG nuclease family protein [Anaerolineae bacterium]
MTTFKFVSKRYPTQAGCYLMKDGNGVVIYVGKAKNLRRRLASYFQKKHRVRRTRRLVKAIRDIEIMIVHNESESLILESNLIKHYRPKFNRAGKSKKSGLPYIVLTNEEVPRFAPYKKHRPNYDLDSVPETNIAHRFGPYISNRFRDVVLDFVRDHFQLRACHPLPHQVCLLFHMHKCSGICEGRVTAEKYAEDVQRAIEFLSLQHTRILHEVEEEMHACAKRLEFERAAYLKEQVAALRHALENQVVERNIDDAEDVIFCGESHGLIAEIRHGILLHMHLYTLNQEKHDDYLQGHYSNNYPHRIYINHTDTIRKLKKQLPSSSRIRKPNNDTLKMLMALCELNYDYRLADRHSLA